MKRWFVPLVLLLAWASPAQAALPYYEFSPDYAQSLLVASSETVSEVFLPLNDYLSSFDVWLSNGDQGGDVTFTLFNSADVTVATRTLSVPAIADSQNGTRFHVSLPGQIAVAGTHAYRVQIATSVPTMRLYYADATRLLAHNGSPLPAYTGGLARIGDEDKGYSFKFALYETQESSAPQLSGVTVSQQSPSQATIAFYSNEPVDRHVQYGAQELDWSSGYTSCSPGVDACTAVLAVSPGTTYNYTLSVRDVWGNQSSATGTFATLGEGQTPTPTVSVSVSPAPTTPPPGASTTPDTSPGFITNLRIVGLTDRSVGVAWTTREAATSLLVVQSFPLLLSAGGTSDPTLELEHYLRVGGLDPDNGYIAMITAAYPVGNSATASVSFLTLHLSPTPTPGQTGSPTPTPSSSVGTGGTDTVPVISWSPPPAGPPTDGYRVDVFDENNNLVRTITVLPGQLQVALNLLPPGKNRIIVYANNGGVYEKIADPAQVDVRARTSLLERILGSSPYILAAIVVAVGATVVIIKRRKKTADISPPPATPPVTSSL